MVFSVNVVFNIIIFQLKTRTINTNFEQSRNEPQRLTTTNNVFLISHHTLEMIMVINIGSQNQRVEHLMEMIRPHLVHVPYQKACMGPWRMVLEKIGPVKGGDYFWLQP